jgi:hypothetical protein
MMKSPIPDPDRVHGMERVVVCPEGMETAVSAAGISRTVAPV